MSDGDSKSGFELKVIAPEVDIDSFSESGPDREYPIESSSTSVTLTDKTFKIFSSRVLLEIKSSNTGGSLTLVTSTVTLAVAEVPSTLTE